MKKLILRILTALMTFVMLIAEFPLTDGQIAFAEDAEINHQIPEISGTVYSLGEWLYVVNENEAIITGYANVSETEISIPFALDGKKVTGIADNAFAANTGLISLNVSSYVVRIGNNIFGNNECVKICAASGAYALQYANENQIGYQNLTNSRGGIHTFSETVIDMSGFDVNDYTVYGKEKIKTTQNIARLLRVGDVVYIPEKSTSTDIFAGRINSKTLDGNFVILNIGNVENIGEVLSSTEFYNVPLQLDRSTIRTAEGITLVEDDETVSGSGSSEVSTSIEKPISLKIDLTIPVRKETVLNGSKFKKANWKYDKYGRIINSEEGYSEHVREHKVNVNVKISGSYTHKTSLTVSAKVAYGLQWGWPPIEISIPKCEIVQTDVDTHKLSISANVDSSFEIFTATYVGPYGIMVQLSCNMNLSVSGEASITYEVKKTTTYTLSNGKVSKDVQKNVPTPTMNGSFEAAFSLNMTLSIKWGFKLLEWEASITLFSVGATLKFSITVQKQNIQSLFPCLDFEVKVDLIYKFSVGIVNLTLGSQSVDLSLCYTRSATINLFKYHLHKDDQGGTDWVKVNKCLAVNRTVEFKNDETGSENFATSKGNAGQKIKQPSSNPEKNGYRFKGWYYDDGKSCMKWDFSKNYLPYLKNENAFYVFRPIWEDKYPVTQIEIDKSSITGLSNVGETDKISVKKILPTNANEKGVKWSSSNTSVATVDGNGNVKLKNAGTAVITCMSEKYPSVKATCTVTVRQSVTGISLNKNNIFRYSNNMGGEQLTATVQPANAYDKSVVWTSSNPAVAAVSDNGYVTFNGLGTAVITCSSVTNPKVTATCTVAVRQAVTGLTLDKESELRTNADMSPLKLTATVAPADAYNKSLTWRSDNTDVATVSADGVVSMKGVGTAVITCASVSNPEITTTFTLEILEAVREIILTPDAVTRYSDEKEPVQLTPTILPDNAGNKSVTWETGDPDVVTVDENGTVTVVGAGQTIVMCRSVSDPDVTGTCNFNILQAVESIELNKASVNTTTDEVNPVYLRADVYPLDAYDKSVTWESNDDSVATVTNDGIVVLKGAGDAVITCRSVSTPYVTAMCNIHIENAVSGLSLKERSIVRYSNDKSGIQMIAVLEAAELSVREIRWSTSDDSVAAVSDSGIVSVVAPGEAVITATSVSNPDVSAECGVTVLQSVTSITLNETEIVRDSDDLGTVQLTASVAPADAVNKALRWESSAPAVATVNDEGLVTLVGTGSAVITCSSLSDPDTKAICTVTVNQVVTSLRMNMSRVTRYTSETGDLHLQAYALPSFAPDRGVIWESSDTDVAQVDENGYLTVLSAGTAVITAKSVSKPGLTASCSLTVLQGAESVALSESSLTLYNDQSDVTKLSAAVSPVNAENKDVVWTSSNEDVAVVSDEGEITVVGTGNAVITCTSAGNPNASASCTVTVKHAVQNIILNESEIVCYPDDVTEWQLTASVQPAYADNKDVTWASSDAGVVTVAADGTLTITGVGEAVITCVSNEKPSVTASCTVTVKQPMSGIVLDRMTVELYNDDENGVQLTASVFPEDTDDRDVIWRSDNEYVAIVDDDGNVMPMGSGTANITCHSARRPEDIVAACAVTVHQRVEAIDIEADTASALPGEIVQLNAVCYPDYAAVRTVTWSSDDPSIASVDENGLITAMNYGTAVITATSEDGGDVSAEWMVRVDHELTLEQTEDESTVFSDGNEDVIIASVRLSDASARRMTEAGFEPVWTLVKADDSDDVVMTILPTVAVDRGEEYDTTYVILDGTQFGPAGSRTYTVRCEAGPYSAAAEIELTVEAPEIAQSIILSPSSFTVGIGDEVLIPYIPQSADRYSLPEGITLVDLDGDKAFTEHASLIEEVNGCAVSFDASGIYTAAAHYAAHNIGYDVNLTFYVMDDDGVVHIPLEELELSENYLSMLEESTHTLTYTYGPVDAYDPSVTWASTDEDVITVDQNGCITAVAAGFAGVVCTANDGSGVTDICAVKVEKILQLDDEELSYTVYTGGNDHADLGIVNVTVDSEYRLLDRDLNVTWSLEKLSGNATDIALEEFRAVAEDGITVSGNKIRLLRITGTGDDQYRITCRGGEYSDSCILNIHVSDRELPAAVTLKNTSYTGTVAEIVMVDTGYTSDLLPEDTDVRINGGNAFEHALSSEYDFTEPEKLIFSTPGTYNADVVFSGDNFEYICPITIVIRDENGNVPVNITDLNVDPLWANLLVGEQISLNCMAEPADAVYSKATWTSSDTSIASVSSDGKVTAISAGMAFVSVTVPETDFTGSCWVVVEDGLTLQQDGISRTVYLDGITRTQLDAVQLTPSSSQRLTEAPVWQLTRVSGNNLTLKTAEYNSTDADGNLIYGCAIRLYSMSREGTAEYELTCTAGDETVSIPVSVTSVSRERDIPAGLTLENNVFTGNVGELIQIVPEPVCLPEGTAIPDGMRVGLQGNALFSSAVNTDDFCVSQYRTTVSFNRAGVFEAEYIYSYSNMRYVIPVTFRIMDENGDVPILPTTVALSSRSLFLTEGETEALNAVFTPADAEEKGVVWRSTDTTVATVDDNGIVTAVGNGQAYIICTPVDQYLSQMVCTVWVEDYLTLDTEDEYVSLYLQGNQINEVFSALLSEGTIKRLSDDGLTPVWKLSRLSGTHTDVMTASSINNDAFVVTTAALMSGGKDKFRVTCSAGDYIVTKDFEVEVVNLSNAASAVTLAEPEVYTIPGRTVQIDFTPVCTPAGSVIPQNDNMWSLYSGLGSAFYDAIDWDVYSEDENLVTLGFTKPGRYLFSKQYFLDNLHYRQVCEIIVGEPSESYGLLEVSSTENVVFTGGSIGKFAEVNLSDTIITDVFDSGIEWYAERISGNSLDVFLEPVRNGVELYTASADHAGEDVWRVTCLLGDYSESVDISVSVRDPRSPVPEGVTLSLDRVDGMMGDWLALPIAVSCRPVGTDLPETGDDFWHFDPIGSTADVSEWEIEDGVLRIKFHQPGYYAGTLVYSAGNFNYSNQVYFYVTDEEGVLPAPALDLYLLQMPDTVYTGGQSSIVIGTAQISRGCGDYYTGEAAAYLKEHGAAWEIRVTSGTAAALAIEEKDINSAYLILTSVNSTGDITYEVRCTVDSKVYTKERKLTVLGAEEAMPDPALKRSTYYTSTGQTLNISTSLFDRGTGSMLQGTTEWDLGDLLASIGYEYVMTGNGLQMTFYTAGTYNTTVDATVGNLTYKIPITIVVTPGQIPHYKIMELPAMLTVIGDYAFEGVGAEAVDLRNTSVSQIGAGAFRNCADLSIIYIPSSVMEIANDAFYGCLNLTIVCEPGSEAEKFAQLNGIPVLFE